MGQLPGMVCFFIISHSSLSSFPGFNSTLSGIPILPRSCNGAAKRNASIKAMSIPSFCAINSILVSVSYYPIHANNHQLKKNRDNSWIRRNFVNLNPVIKNHKRIQVHFYHKILQTYKQWDNIDDALNNLTFEMT